MEVLIIKKYSVLITLVLLISFMIESYFILRINNINKITVILLTLSLIILPPLTIYWLFLRSMMKLFVYSSFIICLSISYLIIPSSQKGFFNQILIWIIPILEFSILFIILYSIIKSIVQYKKSNENKENNFIEIIRISLEQKLGDGFLLEAILTELSVFYYSIVVWFIKPKIIKNGKVYSYHKTSQIKTIVIVFSILIVLEGVLFHFLIQLWSDIAAWIFTVINIYALLYMIGLYNSARFLPHIIYSNKLIIRLGYQSSVELDIRNIESIQATKKQGGIGENISKETYYAILNIDSPQYEIILKEPALMKSSYGRKKYVKTIIFRCDEPMKIVSEINNNSNFLKDKQ